MFLFFPPPPLLVLVLVPFLFFFLSYSLLFFFFGLWLATPIFALDMFAWICSPSLTADGCGWDDVTSCVAGISARVMPKEEEEVVYCDAFMRVAFAEAQKALAEGEVPVGCVLVPVEASCEVNAGLVDDEEGSDVVRRLIAARGRNATNKERHALAHAEFVAVEALLHDAAMRGVEAPANLAGYVLYVVVEPCIMCAAMLLYNRVRKVYFGCGNPRFGGNGTVLAVHNAQAANAPGYESHGGHRADQAVALLQEFYRHENANAPGHKRRRKGS